MPLCITPTRTSAPSKPGRRGSARKRIGAKLRRSGGRRWNNGRRRFLPPAAWPIPEPRRLAPFMLLEQWKLHALTKLSPTCSNRERSHSGSTLFPSRGNPFMRNVATELRDRCPGLLPASGLGPLWTRSLFSSLIRFGESNWSGAARSEGWYVALRYEVVHHPRYQRLIHYNQRCHDEWSQARRSSSPSFSEWFGAADVYCAARRA